MAAAPWDKLRDLGYEVALASVTADGEEIYHVTGHGAEVYTYAGDETLKGLLDAKAHKARTDPPEPNPDPLLAALRDASSFEEFKRNLLGGKG